MAEETEYACDARRVRRADFTLGEQARESLRDENYFRYGQRCMAEETEYACGARRVPLITCRAAIDFIPDYLSAGIAPSTTVPFQKHINACADCAAILHTYRKTIELTRSFFHGPDFAPRPACNSAFSRRRIRSTHPLIVK